MKTILTILVLALADVIGEAADPAFQAPPINSAESADTKVLDSMHALEAALGKTNDSPAPTPTTPTVVTTTVVTQATKPVVPAPAATPVPVVTAIPAVPAPVAQPAFTPPAPPVMQPAAPVVQPVVPVVVAVPQPPAPEAVVNTNTAPAPRPIRQAPHRMPAPLAFPSMPGAPGMPTTMNPPPSAPVISAANPAPAAAQILHAHALHFQAAKLESVLTVYTSLVNRNILRGAQLPDAAITFDNVTDLTYDEAVQALNSVLGMNGVTLIPIGEKFVKVVPTAQANSEAAPLNSVTNSADLPELGGYVTHVVQLKYAKPSEVAQVLASFSKVQGSILPLDSNGILILRDFTENVKRMLEMIDQINVTVPSEFVSEVIPIKYALASDIASALNSVGGGSSSSIGSSGAGGSRTGSTTGRSYGAGATGTTTPGLAGANNGINNSMNRTPVATGAPGAAGAAANTPTFAQRLQSLISKAGSSGDIQLIGPNKIIPDERTNSLLVFATREDMATIKDIVAKLDVVLAQVLIEAIILDVTLGNDFSLGVTAGQAPTALSRNGSVLGGGAINNGNGSINTGNSFLNSLTQIFGTNGAGSNVLTGVITNLTFPSGDGLTYFGKIGPQWDVAISALSDANNVKILARPSIQTSHAVPASIFVGETDPYITGTSYDSYNGGSHSQYQQTQIGISLNVTPLINPDGLVVMDIQQQVQQPGTPVKIDGNPVPTTKDQNASAKVAVKNGETIVMGGFIQDLKTEGKQGIPLLMDIPYLGALFRSTTTSDTRRELLVMIRPTVLPTPEAAAIQTGVERDRHPTLKEAEAEFEADNAKLLKHANKAAIKAKAAVEAAEKADAKADADAAAKAASQK